MELELLVAFERFPYPGLGPYQKAFCLLEVFRTPDGHIVAVATERMDNPGASVTNAAEKLWAQVARHLEGWGKLRCVERYVDGDGVRLDEVVIVDGRATWSPLFDAPSLEAALLTQSGQFDRVASY